VDYVTSRRGKGLSNEPMEVSYEDIMRIWRISDEEAELVRRVTESSYRGESYYPDGKPGIGKLANERHAFYKEVLYRDPKTSGFVMQYPHGVIINQARRSTIFEGKTRSIRAALRLCIDPWRRLTMKETGSSTGSWPICA